MNKILFIAPIPPPITGHSIASKVILEELGKEYEILKINLSKESFKEGVDGFQRIVDVIKILGAVWKKRKSADLVYFTISESFAGNIKDLLIYALCFNKLSKTFIHLHGGSIKRLLWDKHPFIYRLNRFFIKRLAGVIILGESHREIFSQFIPDNKIHIVPNFAQEYLFCSQEQVSRKFYNLNPTTILYMSNLVTQKGYQELLDAFFELPAALKNNIRVNFAGGFESDKEKTLFLDRINDSDSIQYHGVVDSSAKQELFRAAHIFCLPTSYFEGQPISILEAYASGCVVLTTGQKGILDVFEDKVNGYLISNRSTESVKNAIIKAVDQQHTFEKIALSNLETAKKNYRIANYYKAIRKIIQIN